MSATVDVEEGECDFCGQRCIVAVSEQHRRKASICRECVVWAREQFAESPPGSVIRSQGREVPEPAAPPEPCPVCKPPEGRVNHVVGHIFVGWGIGWQPCTHCGGSGRAP